MTDTSGVFLLNCSVLFRFCKVAALEGFVRDLLDLLPVVYPAIAVLNACLTMTRSTGIEVATMVMAHSATAHMMDLYDSSVTVNNGLHISRTALQDTSCTVNFAMYVDRIIDVTPALR